MKDDSAVIKRLVSSSVEITLDPGDDKNAMFQHSVLCQTSLPYRDPGADVIEWFREQGRVSLRVSANKIRHPETKEWIQMGIPFGPKARLILCHINTQAIQTQSSVINVEESMTAFVNRLGLNTGGRSIRAVKDQIARLAASMISLSYSDGEGATQVDTKIIKAFDVWFPKDHRRRVIWQSSIQLSDDYFNSLANHAIPLDERALASMANNAMALDIYCWLAQRLHRIPHNRPQFVDWKSLKQQFGEGYGRMDKFKAVFRKTLAKVITQYPRAKLTEDRNKGFVLQNSPTPITARQVQISGLSK